MKQIITPFVTLILFICSPVLYSMSQEPGDNVCGTDAYYEAQKKAHPELQQLEKLANERAREYVQKQPAKKKRQGEPRVIPVVFHVIHGGGEENLARQQLLDNLERLNVDFQKRNEDTADVNPVFKDRIGDYNIEFRLARKTPSGDCFNGITREYHPDLTDDSLWLSNLTNYTSRINYWNREHYLNIWVVEDIYDNSPNSDIAGQANYPWSDHGADGIIMRADQIEYQDRTLTHEVGHYLGLYHTFRHGCETGDCENQNDKVCDVPPTADRETVTDCNAIQNSCDGAEWRIDSVTILDTSASPTDLDTASLNAASLYLEDFEEPQSNSWKIFSASSDIDWAYETVDTHQVASIKGYQADTPNNDWLISPALKFDQSDSNFYFSFKNVRISEGGTFSVKISHNYNGQSNPTDTAFDWIDVTNKFDLSEGFFDDEFTESYNLQTYNSDSFYVAFQYETTPEVHLPDMKGNYMDYSNCRRMFSQGQTERSDAYLYDTQYRQELISDQNLARTGVKEQIDGTPLADFMTADTEVCEGNQIQFENLGCAGTPDSIEWHFEGGIPEKSGRTNPVVRYEEPGTYDVSLKLINQEGTDSLIKSDYIDILESHETPVNFSFRENNQKALGFRMDSNLYGNRWQKTDGAGAGDNQSLYLGNYNIDEEQDVTFRLPPLDLTGIDNPVLRFDMAYATRSDNSSDILLLQSSSDCAENWDHLAFLFNHSIQTKSGVQSPYFPESTEEWKTHEVSLEDLKADTNAIVRFVMQTSNGNNVFVDNIRIEKKNTSIEDAKANERVDFQFYPNPVHEQLTIEYPGNQKMQSKLQVFNTLGHQVDQRAIDWDPGETKKFMPPELGMNKPGIYIIRIQTNGQTVIKSITLTR